MGALNNHTAGCTQLNIGEGISKFLFRKNADTAEPVPGYFLLSTQFFTDFTFRLINVRAQGGIHFFFQPDGNAEYLFYFTEATHLSYKGGTTPAELP